MPVARPPICDGDYVYVFFGKTGALAAKTSFELLSHSVFESDKSDFNGSPAVSGGRLFLRSNKNLYCIEAN